MCCDMSLKRFITNSQPPSAEEAHPSVHLPFVREILETQTFTGGFWRVLLVMSPCMAGSALICISYVEVPTSNAHSWLCGTLHTWAEY